MAALHGDQAATRQLLNFLWPLVLKYCVDRFGERRLSVAGADDCAQETLIAVVAALPTYRYPSVNFLPFVYGIAGHKVADSFRSHSRDRSDSVSDFAAIDEFERYPLSEDIDRIDERVMIERFLTKLPPLHREILRMRVIDGYSAEETADGTRSICPAQAPCVRPNIERSPHCVRRWPIRIRDAERAETLRMPNSPFRESRGR